MADPHEIATWRYEVIAPLTDASLSPDQRKAALVDRTTGTVRGPDGQECPIPRSTLYRWLARYRKDGYEGLLPRERSDRGRRRADRTAWVEKAMHLLLERPDRSLGLLLPMLRTWYPDHTLSRSTLEREIKRHPAWPAVQRQRKKDRRRRRRFQAKAPHAIWQLDAKGPFVVYLMDGTTRKVTVLTVLDDCSRAVLAVVVAATEHLGAAVRAFRRAAMRWGLPNALYADRHSVYDSLPFRRGIAVLGVHRVRTRPRNAPARGKIEAYHRVLSSWFVGELPHQEVVDLAHLEDLLVAVIELVYQPHRHREIRSSPKEALGDQRSARGTSPGDLERAFWVAKTKKAHPKTGEVALPGGTFLVPAGHEGRKVELRWDPEHPERVFLVGPRGALLPVKCARQPEPERTQARSPQRRGTGALQRLLDKYQGRDLPLAPAGYGLPEVFDAFGRALGRRVPASEHEATAIQDFYAGRGPFEREAFEAALARTLSALGPERPLSAILYHLARQVRPPHMEDEA